MLVRSHDRCSRRAKLRLRERDAQARDCSVHGVATRLGYSDVTTIARSVAQASRGSAGRRRKTTRHDRRPGSVAEIVLERVDTDTNSTTTPVSVYRNRSHATAPSASRLSRSAPRRVGVFLAITYFARIDARHGNHNYQLSSTASRRSSRRRLRGLPLAPPLLLLLLPRRSLASPLHTSCASRS